MMLYDNHIPVNVFEILVADTVVDNLKCQHHVECLMYCVLFIISQNGPKKPSLITVSLTRL